MKFLKLIGTVLFLLTAVPMNANERLFTDDTSGKHTKPEPLHECASITIVKLNVLYIGIDNPLIVDVKYNSTDKLTVTIKGGGGTITRVAESRYIARVSAPADDCSITISINDKIAYIGIFRARYIPFPHAAVGDQLSGSTIAADKLCEMGGIKVKMTIPFDIDYGIIRYSVKLLPVTGSALTFENTGPSFNTEVKQAICNLKSGALVLIENILVKEASGRDLILPSLVYYIQ